ncbi:unnamed protein product [Lymnaea stagnalis]|uniref:Failed axon connections homolog n=1 Tax=Lymnaea stagnalis TaxID=6523 RepID=A0AAV2H3D4_LYMST
MVASICMDIIIATISATCVLLAVAFIVRCLIKGRRPHPPVPTDTVCLYQVGRGPWTPSLSPFPLKLETFLRMHKIPYMNDHSGKMSSKGKTPWMTYNGISVADSQMCIEFLKQERGLDTGSHLSTEEKATARALRCLVEENLYWTMCYETFIKNPKSLDILLKDVFPWLKTFLFKKLMGREIKKQLRGQGIGRHKDSEIWDIGRGDLQAISEFLGSKKYMFGGEPTEVDCAMFGMLAMIVWQMKGSRHEQLIHAELHNLVDYCERMQRLFWPDWMERCVGKHFVKDDFVIYSF